MVKYLIAYSLLRGQRNIVALVDVVYRPLSIRWDGNETPTACTIVPVEDAIASGLRNQGGGDLYLVFNLMEDGTLEQVNFPSNQSCISALPLTR